MLQYRTHVLRPSVSVSSRTYYFFSPLSPAIADHIANCLPSCSLYLHKRFRAFVLSLSLLHSFITRQYEPSKQNVNWFSAFSVGVTILFQNVVLNTCTRFTVFFLRFYFVTLHDTICLHLAEEQTSRFYNDIHVFFLTVLSRIWTPCSLRKTQISAGSQFITVMIVELPWNFWRV